MQAHVAKQLSFCAGLPAAISYLRVLQPPGCKLQEKTSVAAHGRLTNLLNIWNSGPSIVFVRLLTACIFNLKAVLAICFYIQATQP